MPVVRVPNDEEVCWFRESIDQASASMRMASLLKGL
jgi:hypothetical protein